MLDRLPGHERSWLVNGSAQCGYKFKLVGRRPRRARGRRLEQPIQGRACGLFTYLRAKAQQPSPRTIVGRPPSSRRPHGSAAGATARRHEEADNRIRLGGGGAPGRGREPARPGRATPRTPGRSIGRYARAQQNSCPCSACSLAVQLCNAPRACSEGRGPTEVRRDPGRGQEESDGAWSTRVREASRIPTSPRGSRSAALLPAANSRGRPDLQVGTTQFLDAGRRTPVHRHKNFSSPDSARVNKGAHPAEGFADSWGGGGGASPSTSATDNSPRQTLGRPRRTSASA